MSPKALSRLVLIPLALGGLLRLYYVRSTAALYHVSGDGEEGYYETASALLQLHTLSPGIPDTHPSAFRGPIYPVFIALVESPFAHPHPRQVRMAQVALGLLEIAAAFALGRFILSPLAGLLAALWIAVDLNLVLSAASLNVHAFYGFCMLALAVAAVLWVETRSVASTVVFGWLLAITLLCRSAHYPLPLLFLAAYLLWWRFPDRRWKVVGVMAASTALFLSPMVARNAVQFKRFILLDTYKGSYIFLQSTMGGYVNTTVGQAMDSA
ncbi:MAG TPA: glycosyltransferase family 39 protein, partial [Elusimicrobiota bacterium]|nr:glycosyltransferase family 39 protein [Elusimicrobiota bacterium]